MATAFHVLAHHWKLLHSRVLARPLRHAASARLGIARDGTAQGWGRARGACRRGACAPGDYAQDTCAWGRQAASLQPRARRGWIKRSRCGPAVRNSVYTGASLKLAACVPEVSSSATGTAQPLFFRVTRSRSSAFGKGWIRTARKNRRRG